MRRLPKPTFTAAVVFDLCVRSVRDEDLKMRLKAALPIVEAAEVEYVAHGDVGRWYEIKSSIKVDKVSNKEMENLYNRTFVKSVRTKPIYSALKKACNNDMCPLCGQRTVHQLDHYLPISLHPALAVTAINLVPACAECNKVKLAYAATTAVDQTLHPYFDDVTTIRWLYADVVQTVPASVTFRAGPPKEIGMLLQKRIVKHFNTFALGALYTSHAAEEISNLRFGLAKIAQTTDSVTAVRAHLISEAESRGAAHLNSWQTAMYEALFNSDWFCSTGYLQT